MNEIEHLDGFIVARRLALEDVLVISGKKRYVRLVSELFHSGSGEIDVLNRRRDEHRVRVRADVLVAFLFLVVLGRRDYAEVALHFAEVRGVDKAVHHEERVIAHELGRSGSEISYVVIDEEIEHL